MSAVERRGHERVPTKLKVRYGTHGFDLAAPVENISLSGMCIRTNDVFPAGTRIKIQIEFPDRRVVHTAEVLWAIKVPERDKEAMMCGMGIQFIDPEPEWAGFFASWKASLA